MCDMKREGLGKAYVVWVKVYTVYESEVVDESKITCARQMSFPKRYKIGNMARFVRDIRLPGG